MISVIPRATEKAYGQSLNNVYVFDVNPKFNRDQISAAVSGQFGVKVVKVKTLVQNGKAVRYSRGKRAYPGNTTRRDFKKAYVTLAEGDSIKVFDTPAEEPAKEKK